MTVIYIKQSSAKGYLRVGVSADKEYSFTVSEREYTELGAVLVGDALSEEAFATLSLADERYRAKLKALRVLSYGDNSEGALMRKLRCAGISAGVAKETVSEMVSLGYVNSRRQLKKLITSEVNIRNTGPGVLIPKLISKGYKKSEIEEVIEELLSSGEIDFAAAKARVLAKCADEDRRKTLYKKGYAE